jgi:hypothetical protein
LKNVCDKRATKTSYLGNGTNRGKKKFTVDPNKFLYNVDTLWYTFDALNYDAVMQQGLLDKLQAGKMLAEEGTYSTAMDYVQVDLERYDYPVTFEIQASGQAPVYAFSIRNHDMAFYFARRRRDDGTYPVKVQIKTSLSFGKWVCMMLIRRVYTYCLDSVLSVKQLSQTVLICVYIVISGIGGIVT